MSTGHILARQLIEKHGIDRYPTIEGSLLKLMTEVGELVDAWQKPEGIQPPKPDRIRKEYGDVGLTLYTLGDKLGLDLLREMSDVVENETRKFA